MTRATRSMRGRTAAGIVFCGLVGAGVGLGFSGSAPAAGSGLSISGSMEGALDIHAGDWIAAGYHFSVGGSKGGGSYLFDGAQVAIPVTCGGGGGGTMVVPLDPGPWTVAAGEGKNVPWNNQSDPGSYQGAVQAPDLCGGGAMHNGGGAGATFTASLQSTNTSDPVAVQFHYRDPAAKGKGNHNCADPADPKAGDAATCGASVSPTDHPTPSTTTTTKPGDTTTTTTHHNTTTTTTPCEGTTTTTAPCETTTTTTPGQTTTTTTPCETTTSVAGSSSTTAPCTSPTTVAVLGQTFLPNELAATGSNTSLRLLVASVMFLAGLALALAVRRIPADSPTR